MVRARYKQTEVGEIPEDWDVKNINSIALITTGGKNTQDRIGDGFYPFYVRSQVVERINSCSFDGEAVLTAGDGVGTGKIFHYINGKFDYHQRVYNIHGFKPEVDGFYFYKYFSSKFYDRIMSMTAKSSVDSVRREMISKMKIAFPAEPEQKAIAKALSDVDELIVSLEKLIAKKRDIKTATMQQLLTGNLRLPGFGEGKGYKQTELGEIPEDWDVLTFERIVNLKNNRINPKITGGGDGCIELEHLNQGKGTVNGVTLTTAVSSIKNVFGVNDVLFGKLRSYLKKYWIADFDGVCSTEIWVLQAVKGISSPNYLYQIIQMDKFIECASEAYGTHMPRADWAVVKEFAVAIPSINEQGEISSVLIDMDNEINRLEIKVEKTKAIKQGMMQELLTGRTRLVDAAATSKSKVT